MTAKRAATKTPRHLDNGSGVEVTVRAFEVLLPAASIAIRVSAPVDDRAASDAISLDGRRAPLKLAANGRSLTLDAPMQPGLHLLRIDELVSVEGARLGEAVAVPFSVAASKAPVSATLSVESLVRVRYDGLSAVRLSPYALPKGKFVDFIKAVDRRSGARVELAFDRDGRTIDARQVVADFHRRRLKAFGKIHETLYARLAGETPLDVAIWLRTPPETPADKALKTPAKHPPAEDRAFRKQVARLGNELMAVLRADYHVEAARLDAVAPVVHATLLPRQVRSLGKDPRVGGLFLRETSGIDDLQDSIAITRSNVVHALGFDGDGINVAVWEDGPDNLTNLAIVDRFKIISATSEHSRHTHGIVRNVERSAPHGHAPACRLHSANDKDLDAIAWAAQEKGCTAINQSFHRSSEPGSGSLSFDDLYKDYLALHWPYPSILQAAGNFFATDPDDIDPPESEFVNHKGFNSLAVGNHNDGATSMSGSSVFRNPNTPHADRELPEICANGTSVTTVGLTKSGTSMAAPAATGVAALLQDRAPALGSWPEGVRAILMAGASRNVTGQTWWQDVSSAVDASDGAGAIDALESVRIAGSRRSPTSAAARRGWDVGSIRTSDFGPNDESTFSYTIQVPTAILVPQVKVALAWTSRVEVVNLPIVGPFPVDSQLTMDLDLKVFDGAGALVGYSGSWDNSYEIAEFDARRGARYTVRIRRWDGDDRVFFGLAWTVRGIEFADPLPILPARRASTARGARRASPPTRRRTR